ncbi:MAG: peptidase M15 [Prevotella sp.]|jgi:uncharacterized protein YcbK (DUF882 family)|nr:peptidase M15 [Prevotella sp.]
MATTRITENFTLEELCHSDTAAARGLKNIPDEDQVDNLKRLAINLLQPVRDRYGKAMHINSGFRSPEVNKAVNGSPTSDHMHGKAADVRTDNPRELFDLVRKSGLSFDQLILYPSFVHMSFRYNANRNQVLYAKGVHP